MNNQQQAQQTQSNLKVVNGIIHGHEGFKRIVLDQAFCPVQACESREGGSYQMSGSGDYIVKSNFRGDSRKGRDGLVVYRNDNGKPVRTGTEETIRVLMGMDKNANVREWLMSRHTIDGNVLIPDSVSTYKKRLVDVVAAKRERLAAFLTVYGIKNVGQYGRDYLMDLALRSAKEGLQLRSKELPEGHLESLSEAVTSIEDWAEVEEFFLGSNSDGSVARHLQIVTTLHIPKMQLVDRVKGYEAFPYIIRVMVGTFRDGSRRSMAVNVWRNTNHPMMVTQGEE